MDKLLGIRKDCYICKLKGICGGHGKWLDALPYINDMQAKTMKAAMETFCEYFEVKT
jgi:hypothetical protein